MGDVKTISEILESATGKKPVAQHKMIYDSAADQLEPIYFFILDLMNDMKLNPKKLVDNFSSSPGSGHYGDMAQKKGINQQQADSAMKTIFTILRSVQNLIYDLKEFEIRLNTYKDLESKDKATQKGAKLSLKQIWLDKVDMMKGNSSISMLARQLGFQALFDAFYSVENEKEAEKLDLNERMKRLVKARILEFNTWIKHSEKELTKRYNIEKAYLRSQVNSLKLYSRWIKPYLLAAERLESKESTDAALVNIFNTTIQELTLFGKKEVDVVDAALSEDLPPEFTKLEKKGVFKRKFSQCVIVDFRFRGIPRKVTQRGDYVFGGRTEMTFRGYALHEEEIKKFEQELEKSDIEDVLPLIKGATDDSLKELQEEIEYFLGDKKQEDEKKEEKKEKGNNPFLALIGFYNEKPKKEEKKDEKIVNIKKDDWYEKEYIRKLTEKKTEETTFKLFSTYKKAFGMPSY